MVRSLTDITLTDAILAGMEDWARERRAWARERDILVRERDDAIAERDAALAAQGCTEHDSQRWDEPNPQPHLPGWQWDRIMEGIKLWRAENPEERDCVLPDIGPLVTWLIERGNRAHRLIDHLSAEAERGYDPSQLRARRIRPTDTAPQTSGP